MAELILTALRWNLLTVWLPVAIVAASAVCTAILIRRDRYRRRLALVPSPETEQIRRLVENGAIDSGAAEKLLAECDALPEVRERSPLPDLPLKLVSAFGRIYSVMKIVMLAGVAATFAAIRLYAGTRKDGGNYEFNGEHLPLLLAGTALVLVLAICEYIAAVRILHGSIKARNFLIFSWMINFLLIRAMLSPFDSSFYWALTAGCGVYTLYVLLFRRDARRKISAEGGETGRGGKIAVGLLAAAALAAGLTLFSAQSSHVYENSATMVNFISNDHGPLHIEVENMILIPGSPDGETAELCELLAEAFQANSGPLCEIRRFGEPVPVDNLLQKLPVVVTRVEYLPPEPVRGFRKILIRNLCPEAAAANDLFESFTGKMKLFRCFRLETAMGIHSVSYLWKGLSLTENPLNFSGTFLAATTNPEGARKSLERIAALAAKQWNGIQEKRRGKPVVKLPEIPVDETTPLLLDLDLSAFPGAAPLYTGRGKYINTVALYRFDPPRTPEERQKLVRALESQGFRRDSGNGFGGIVRFEKNAPSVTLTLRFPDGQQMFGELNCRRPYGELLYIRRGYEENAKIDLEFLRKFAASDPRAFALMGGLRYLPAAERREIFAKVLRDTPPDRVEKLIIWQYFRGIDDPLEPEAERFFHSLAEEVLDDFASPDFLGEVGTLLDSTRKMPEKQAFLLERLAPVRERIKLPATPGENGIVTAKHRIRRTPLLPSRLLLEIEIPGKPLLRIAAGLTEMPDGNLKAEVAGMSSSGIPRQELSDHSFQSSYVRFGAAGNWQRIGSSHGRRFDDIQNSSLPSGVPPESGKLNFHLQFDETASEYVIGIAWNPEKK